MMFVLPLHGTTGYWDEIACLALPATVIMGIALSLMRQDRAGASAGREVENVGDQPAPSREGEG